MDGKKIDWRNVAHLCALYGDKPAVLAELALRRMAESSEAVLNPLEYIAAADTYVEAHSGGPDVVEAARELAALRAKHELRSERVA